MGTNIKRIEDYVNLKRKLENIKNVVRPNIYEYLKGILNLEYSVLKVRLDDDQIDILATTPFYRDIVMYNIYNRLMNIMFSLTMEPIIFANEEGYEGVNVNYPLSGDGDDGYEVVDYNYSVENKLWKPKNYLGMITLYNVLTDKPYDKLDLDDIEYMEYTNLVYNVICDDLGLNEENFNENNSFSSISSDKIAEKILIKKIGNVDIKKVINYI